MTLSATWPCLWDKVHQELKHEGYRHNTRRLYRHCLRRFARHAGVAPEHIQERHIQSYLFQQARSGSTASWIAANITVLRKVFDKLGGRSLTQHLTTPRRPWPLPFVLTLETVHRILAAAPTLRDQLLLGLLYGCGLKVGELCALRWSNIQWVQASPESPRVGILCLSPTREIPIPADLMPILAEGLCRCPAADYIFPGAYVGKPLSPRMVALILQAAVKAARVEGPIDGMALRHSYAIHSLESGLTIRELQLRLGHRRVTTTMIYLRLLHPGVVSPLDRLPATPFHKRDTYYPTSDLLEPSTIPNPQ